MGAEQGCAQGLRWRKAQERSPGHGEAARSIAQLRKKPDLVTPVHTGPAPGSCQGGTGSGRGALPRAAQPEREAGGEASGVREGMGLSDGGGGKKEGRL